MSDLFDDQARDDEAKRDRLRALGWTYYRYPRADKEVWMWSDHKGKPCTEQEAFAWLEEYEKERQ